ncbi:MAG: S8 family serine peptidase, partial [Alphaproteobacteria bacterium]|nr:S8 family serine peptidase [Alphaproteobacteria bacterium]
MSNGSSQQPPGIFYDAASFASAPTDPLYTGGQQWHLNNPNYPASDMNVTAVWDDYRGAGVTVAVIDDGIEYLHADLAANSAPSMGGNFVSANIDAPADGAAYLASDNHGTMVAGVIAADDNNLYGAGVAPDATLASLRIGYGTSGGLDQILGAFLAAKNFDIANNSWSFGGYFYDNFINTNSFGFYTNPFVPIQDALIEAVDQGRGGLGTVFTFAAGNDRSSGQDVNYHAFQSSPYTITVGGHTKFDSDYPASTPGAAVLVSGPAQSVRTTDRMGSAGATYGDTAAATGTSFAAPAVAGVVALMLDANPDLGYRDVQEILSLSSKMVDPTSTAWAVNGSDNWNGGGRHVSHELGYGAVDAFNAVRLAETWDQQATYANMVTLTESLDFGARVDITNALTSTISVGAVAFDLDQVLITVDMAHEYVGDLVVTLEAPSGTVSTLMNRPGFGSGTVTTALTQFQFSSVQYWDEAIAGDWTLTVRDLGSGGSGNMSGWSLDFLGDLDTGNDTYYYSSEWATYGAEAARQVVQDAGGTDTLNFAMIATPVAIDLAPGSVNTLLGRTLTIDAQTLIENAVTGDGDDTLIGNAADNDLRGMRGNDLLEGKAGNDTIDGGAGVDTARFSLPRSDYQITAEADGSYTVAATAGTDGTDHLLGIEFLAFADGIYAIGDLTGGAITDPTPT